MFDIPDPLFHGKEFIVAISKEFVTAGDAIFTIEQPDGTHYTYRVQHVPATERWGESWFVKLLTGPNNKSDYTYMGKLDLHTFQVSTTAKSKKFDGTRPLRLLNRVLARVYGNDHAAYEQHGFKCHHEGWCGRCGHPLTVPASIESGFGPECVKLVGPVVATKAAVKGPVAQDQEPASYFLSDDPAFDVAQLKAHYNNDNELTHWTGYVAGRHTTVYND